LGVPIFGNILNVTLNEVKGLCRKAAGFFSRFAPSE
jgi:hypothetical protein